MSKPASRIIGIIRIAESSKFGVDLSVAVDDSTLGSLLAGLVGKQAEGTELRRRRQSRWLLPPRPLPRVSSRRSVRADLARLRDDLERQYVELAAP